MSTKRIFAPAISLAVLASAASAWATPIGIVELFPSGTAVTVGDVGSGDPPAVVSAIATLAGQTGDGYTYTNNVFLVNDGTASADIFGKSPTGDTYVPSLGDSVLVGGTWSPFDAIPEISIGTLATLSQTGSGFPVPAPMVQTIPTMTAEATAASGATPVYAPMGFLVELQNVTMTGVGSWSTLATVPTHENGAFLASDGVNTLTVFDNPSTYAVGDAFAGMPMPTGGAYNVVGLLDFFSPNAELIPFSITPVPEPATFGLIAIGSAALLRRRRMA